VNYRAISANRSGPDRGAIAPSRSHFSGVRKKNRWTATQVPSSDSSRFVQTRPADGDWEAVQEMFLSSRPRFVRVAYSILRNREDAEDAVQDAFLSACLHLRSFEGRSAFTTWFTRIVMNAALMMRRKRKTVSIEAVSESRTTDESPWTERIPDPQPDPEMVYKEEETRKLIDALLAKMSPILQQAFAMTYYEELSNEEAGASLGIAAGTFKSRLFRARQHLMVQAHLLGAPIRSVQNSRTSSEKSDVGTFAVPPAETLASEIAFS
jgi:RNA polymerase sigma-70 factor, ECF subfamily